MVSFGRMACFVAKGEKPALRWTSRCVLCAALLLWCAGAGAAGVAPDAASPAQQLKAQQAYELGVQEFKLGHFAEAVKAFKSSYQIVASPNSHMMYARALRDLGELGPAYEEMALAQTEATELAVRLPKYAGVAESMEADMQELLKKISVLSLDVHGDLANATVFVGSREVPVERWHAIAVASGNVDVTARLPGGRRVWHAVRTAPGQITRLKLDLSSSEEPQAAEPATPEATTNEPPERRPSHERSEANATEHPLVPWAIAAGAVGVVGITGFVVFGSMSRSTFNDLDQACPNKICPPDRADEIDKGKQQQLLANVGLGFGIAGVALGATLFVMDADHSSSSGSARRVKVVASPTTLGLVGNF